MAQINFVVRQLVRLVYGASLAPGTFPDALAEFEAAAALAPGRLIHRVELGRCLMRVGRKAEALEQLEASLGMDIEDVNAALEKEEAEILLAKLRRELPARSGGGLPLAPLAPALPWASVGAAAAGAGGGGQRPEQ
jgi:tetratricopeptide (TPR) repeat protein